MDGEKAEYKQHGWGRGGGPEAGSRVCLRFGLDYIVGVGRTGDGGERWELVELP